MISTYAPILNWAIPLGGALLTPIIGFIAGKLKNAKAQNVLYFIRNWMATLTTALAIVFSISMVWDVFGGMVENITFSHGSLA